MPSVLLFTNEFSCNLFSVSVPCNFSEEDWLWLYCITESASNSPRSFGSRDYVLPQGNSHSELAGFGSDIILLQVMGCKHGIPSCPLSQAMMDAVLMGSLMDKVQKKKKMGYYWCGSPREHLPLCILFLWIYIKRALIKFNMAWPLNLPLLLPISRW